jgi:ATP-dependent DNA helicase PIF1
MANAPNLQEFMHAPASASSKQSTLGQQSKQSTSSHKFSEFDHWGDFVDVGEGGGLSDDDGDKTEKGKEQKKQNDENDAKFQKSLRAACEILRERAEKRKLASCVAPAQQHSGPSSSLAQRSGVAANTVGFAKGKPRTETDGSLPQSKPRFKSESTTTTTGVVLSQQQNEVLRRVQAGENVLMVGAGGTGKTEVIKHVRAMCESQKRPFAVTALTGRASLLIEGMTLHSWAGIGLAHESAEDLVARMKPFNRKSWSKRNLLLIIDEVSMLSAELMSKLDYIGKSIRSCALPFGGVQVLASGDFLQMPPIEAAYCFKAPVFERAFPPHNRVELKLNFRQSADSEYQRILNNVRYGRHTEDDVAALRARVGFKIPRGKPVTIVYPRRDQVEARNAKKMRALKGEEHVYTHRFVDLLGSRVITAAERVALQKKLEQAPCETRLVLKVGAVVMHTCNTKASASATAKVNGSVGTVVSFDSAGFPVVKFSDGDTITVGPHTWESNCKRVARVQIPLIVAWAVTAHKIQGATLDAAVMDIGANVFERNQAYVILSRVKSLDGVFLASFDPNVIRPCPEAVAFYKSFQETQAPEDEQQPGS